MSSFFFFFFFLLCVIAPDKTMFNPKLLIFYFSTKTFFGILIRSARVRRYRVHTLESYLELRASVALLGWLSWYTSILCSIKGSGVEV